MTTNLTRQFATGIAAFFMTALLLLANAPHGRIDTGLQLQRVAAAGPIER